ncbi:2-dehydro-3-deoxygluconokinase [Spinactinospora alkalitolerans]|uniref:2-dehydro-3-deoxygluconokinase n=1 Tax=Spinactinospora alkalitolerans TaxID=687207 RepID=A0A852U2V4_9ACTN|nr:sugar kinase [Spinactinospora alkalitolerans]NYE48474.1 2-dehydro-3-deoxygluconokinase [Spinactinospora alkalitolerans]
MNTPSSGGVVTLGETLGLLVPDDVGPLFLARSMRLSMGGAESNVAIGLARLGVPACWIGRLGRDPVGDLIERNLLAEGVRCLVRRDDAPTALMLRERRTGTVAGVSYYRHGSAGSHLSPDDLPDGVIEQAETLHISGITPALGEKPAAAVRQAVRRARSAGVPVCLDFNFRSKLWDAATAAPVFRELAADADMLFAGDDEARIALGVDDPGSVQPQDLARELSALGPGEVVIKRGRHGATARICGETIEVPAVPVHTVDSVGAGDAFVAGYLASKLTGGGVHERLSTAAVTGAFAVTVPGDWEALPRRQELSLLAADQDVQR